MDVFRFGGLMERLGIQSGPMQEGKGEGFSGWEANLECTRFYSPQRSIVTTIDGLFVPPAAGMQRERFGNFPFTCVGPLLDTKVAKGQNLRFEALVGGRFRSRCD